MAPLLPVVCSAYVTNASDIIEIFGNDASTGLGAALNDLNCRPNGTVFLAGIGYVVKARIDTTHFQVERDYEGATSVDPDPGVSCTLLPFTPEMANRAELAVQLREYIQLAGLIENTGAGFDAFGTFAHRDDFDDARTGFIYLSLTGDGVIPGWTLFIKLSVGEGDWSDGQHLSDLDAAVARAGDTMLGDLIVPRLGINAIPDATNPLSAIINKALFAAETTANGGDDDVRFTLSKTAAGDLASFLFQTSFSARAEFGLIGNDDFTVKVSPDGVTWFDGLVIDKDDGKVTLSHGETDPVTGDPVMKLVAIPAPGDGLSTVWRCDAARSNSATRTATIDSVAGDLINLTAAIADTFGRWTGAAMAGCAYMRIWNASKVPEQSAWVKASASTSQLQVTNAADIATWAPGDTIRCSDPSSLFGVAMTAVDISPMLQAQFGVVFRQKAVLGKAFSLSTATLGAALDLSGQSSPGTLVSTKSLPALQQDTHVVFCSVQSPISNSNLVFARETGAVGDIASMGLNIFGVYV